MLRVQGGARGARSIQPGHGVYSSQATMEVQYRGIHQPCLLQVSTLAGGLGD